jgi:hypothetical protein
VGYENPYGNGPNPYMAYDVYDKPYLNNHQPFTSDPAGYLKGITTYVGMQRNAEKSGKVPEEPWSPCHSYGNYRNTPNATLSGLNNCHLGTYTKPACCQ